MDPPSSEDPPLHRIIREGKEPILTTDFYLKNVEPKPWILPTPPSNKDTPDLSSTAAADKFTPVIEPDPVQSDFIPGCFLPHKPQFLTSGKKQ